MKRLTKKEFTSRAMALIRARKIFTPHITNNIAIAFSIYLELLAEQDHQLFINRMTTRKSRVDGYVRPKCPQCDTDLVLYIINIPKGHRNRNGYKTLWQCPVCDHEEYSTKTVDGWIQELKKEEDTRKECRAYPWGCWKTIE